MVRTSLSFAVVLLIAAPMALASDDPPEVTHDGLHLVPDSKVARAWVDPEADFSIYKRVGILARTPIDLAIQLSTCARVRGLLHPVADSPGDHQ